jgi:hypothetical protein
LLAFLLIGTASLGQPVSKPFKVCPEVVTSKDTPCRVLGPTTAIVHRIEKEDPRDKEITELKEKVKQMEELIRVLQSK